MKRRLTEQENDLKAIEDPVERSIKLQEFRKAKSDLVVAAKDKEDAIYEQDRELALQKMVEAKMAAA